MSAFRSWWAGVVYSIDATKEDIGRAGFNAGLEEAAKVCEDTFLNRVGSGEYQRVNVTLNRMTDAIRALKDKQP